MAALLVIGLFGLALARLNRGWSREDEEVRATTMSVPDDVWAAFEAALGPADAVGPEAALGDTALLTARTTVGGLVAGESGYVSARAARRDRDGNVWVEAAAVVHPTRIKGRVAIRRDESGVHLYCPPTLASSEDLDLRGHVQIVGQIA